MKNKHWAKKFTRTQLIELFKKLDGNVFMFPRTKRDPNGAIPAGYTYLGQFLAHEMSFNISAFTDFRHSKNHHSSRTLSIDLDSVYARGPIADPIYYDQSYRGRIYLNIIDKVTTGDKDRNVPNRHFESKTIDFKRVEHNRGGPAVPLIPESRNDENILVAHIHLAIIKFHNRMVERILDEKIKDRQSCEYRSLRHGLEDLMVSRASVQQGRSKHSVRRFEKREDTASSSEKESLKGNFMVEVQKLHERLCNIRDTYNEFLDLVSGSSKATPFIGNISSNEISDLEKKIEYLYKGFNYLDYLELLEEERITDLKDTNSKELDIYKLPAQDDIDTLLDHIFALARRETILHFQWVIYHDFLPRIVGATEFSKIEQTFKRWDNKLKKRQKKILNKVILGAFLRFGHFMVRDDYKFTELGTGKRIGTGMNVLNFKEQGRPIPFNVALSTFFHPDGQKASSFDCQVSSIMTSEITRSRINFSNNIVIRNLKQTVNMSLPSAQELASLLRRKRLFDCEMLKADHADIYVEGQSEYKQTILRFLDESFPKGLKWRPKNKDEEFGFSDFLNHTPPWFYMTLEAYILGRNGEHLGPLAGKAVSYFMHKTLYHSEPTILKSEAERSWKPDNSFLGIPENNDFQMMDFLKFAGMIDEETEQEELNSYMTFTRYLRDS